MRIGGIWNWFRIVSNDCRPRKRLDRLFLTMIRINYLRDFEAHNDKPIEISFQIASERCKVS
jgi:hypothetical protein